MTPGHNPQTTVTANPQAVQPRQAVDATLGTTAALKHDEPDIAAMRAAMVTRVRDAGDVRLTPDHTQVLLVLKGRQPSTFDLSVRFGAQEPEEGWRGLFR
ncbi:hypothetical protein ABZT51_36100 [Streptomyces sp. NPDC005373]|uniref:hypothetical protein n=1 Tax=Streptomyces sp. NPDC005373 TaxID=3156879 RepID=UPI0033B22A4E